MTTINNSFEIQKSVLDQDEILITDDVFNYILEGLFNNEIFEMQSIIKNVRKIKYKFGTKEFADRNFNTHYACKYACWNCYAWNEAYQRKRYYWKNWGIQMTKRATCNKKWKKREDNIWIMYPSTHDVLPEISEECLQAIQNMLNANINVLWVSKPCKEVITQVIDRFKNYREGQPRIRIRITVGTDNEKLLSF